MEQRSTTTLIASEEDTHPQELHAAKTVPWNPVWKRWLVLLALVLFDVLLALLSWQVASVLRGLWGREALPIDVAVAIMLPVIAVWVGLRALLGLYPGYGLDSVEELRRHTHAVFATLAVLAVFAVGSQVGDLLSRLMLFLVFLGLLLFTPFVRHFVKQMMKKVGLWGKPVVLLSYAEVEANIMTLLKRNWELGYDPVGVLGYRLDALREGFTEGVDYQQVLAPAADLARNHSVDTVIFAMPYTRREHLAKLVSLASLNFRHVLIIPNLNGVTNSAVLARNLAGTLALEAKFNLLDPWALRAKRVIDLCATIIGGALILPLLLVLALLVYLESGGPVFYKDQRMRQDGKLFSCVKFRTMMPDAEALLHRMLEEDAELRKEYSKYHKLRVDPRVTHVGRFLRKTSLDELPQLWNVLRGEMSLVGPRPYLPRESKEIGIAQSEILRVPPGITGPWQVTGRNQTSFSERVQMDDHYVRDWSVWLDLVILGRTVRSVAFSRGAY